jgi:hypothetical protein
VANQESTRILQLLAGRNRDIWGDAANAAVNAIPWENLDPTVASTPAGAFVDVVQGNTHVPVRFVNWSDSTVWLAVNMLRGSSPEAFPSRPSIKAWYKINGYGGSASVGDTYDQTLEWYAYDEKGREWRGGYFHDFYDAGRQKQSRPFQVWDLGSSWRRQGPRVMELTVGTGGGNSLHLTGGARIDFSILNRTSYNVSFSLGTNHYVLKSGQLGNYWTTMPNPMVRIWQIGGRHLDFTLANHGSYAFQVNPQTGKIQNYYR